MPVPLEPVEKAGLLFFVIFEGSGGILKVGEMEDSEEFGSGGCGEGNAGDAGGFGEFAQVFEAAGHEAFLPGVDVFFFDFDEGIVVVLMDAIPGFNERAHEPGRDLVFSFRAGFGEAKAFGGEEAVFESLDDEAGAGFIEYGEGESANGEDLAGFEDEIVFVFVTDGVEEVAAFFAPEVS